MSEHLGLCAPHSPQAPKPLDFFPQGLVFLPQSVHLIGCKERQSLARPQGRVEARGHSTREVLPVLLQAPHI